MPIPVGAIIGGGMALAGALDMGGNKRRKNQVEQQKKLNDVNAETSKELADYEQALKMKMWEDTNYGAILGQADKAGVSKAAAIGGAVGGAQGASVSGVGGGGAADESSQLQANSGRMMAGMQMAQLSLLEAQKDNIEADTENKKAGAGKAGMETVKGGIETEGAILDNKLKETTLGDNVKTIAMKAEQEVQKAQVMFNERKISDETYRDEITQIRNEAIGSGIDNEVKRLGMNLDRRKVNAIEAAVQQGWDRLILEKREVTVKELAQAAQESYMRKTAGQRDAELTQREWEAIGNFAIGAAGATMKGMPTTTTGGSDTWTEHADGRVTKSSTHSGYTKKN